MKVHTNCFTCLKSPFRIQEQDFKEFFIGFKSLTHEMLFSHSYRVVFLTGSALKVLSVGSGKIPTKKVKVRECHRENVKF